jgi:hypothetical protein
MDLCHAPHHRIAARVDDDAAWRGDSHNPFAERRQAAVLEDSKRAEALRRMAEVRARIELLSERRVQLWHALAEEQNALTRQELRRVERAVERLWHEQRQLRAASLFGDRACILERARVESDLAREADAA